ncbi:hypothetical protein COU61_01100 [Candidatus Pacearchaeota archaeon CG10_big_fil_rev_8_21_14_0_10_35_13]|nr:MAG: hypothetical protein COU61_01100 [Candidatus Pacearchaeota archaeon CG10_big_fil_rev_8_21_14_0_10_35_13]
MNSSDIPYYKQENSDTCAAAVLKMILETLGIKKTEKYLAKVLGTNNKSGVRVENIVSYLERLKLSYAVFRNASLEQAIKKIESGFRIIVGYRHPKMIGHYAILLGADEKNVYLQDPNPHTPKIVKYSKNYFMRLWKRGLKYDKERCWFVGIKRNHNPQTHSLRKDLYSSKRLLK